MYFHNIQVSYQFFLHGHLFDHTQMTEANKMWDQNQNISEHKRFDWMSQMSDNVSEKQNLKFLFTFW